MRPQREAAERHPAAIRGRRAAPSFNEAAARSCGKTPGAFAPARRLFKASMRPQREAAERPIFGPVPP